MTIPLPLIGAPTGLIHDLNADQRWTGEELAAAVARRVAVLSTLPAQQNPVFALLHANSLNFFADLFAVWSVGGTAACLNPGLTHHELDVVLDHLQPLAVLIDGTQAETRKFRVLDLAKEPPPRSANPVRQAGLDCAALVLFTSGTTGAPKAVVLSHRALLARVALNRSEIGIAALSRSLSVLPTHFGHGLIGNALTPLAAGGSLWLMPEAGVAGAASLGHVIDEHRIGFMSSVPSFWKMALRISDQPSGNSLERIHIGSAPLSADLWRDVGSWSRGVECVNAYGTTETANWIGGASSRHHVPEDGLIGTLWGGHAAIRTDDGLSEQGEGELFLQTPTLMSGYLGRDDLTAEVLQHGWYNTGDLGHIDKAGVLRLTGRAKHMINRGGVKLYPEEFDLLLERHDAVAEACAFAIPDPIGGEALAVALSAPVGAELNEDEIMSWLRGKVRSEALPAMIYILSHIPKTGSGKTDRAAVADFCRRQETGT